MKVLIGILGILGLIVGIVVFMGKRSDKISEERRESGVDKQLIEEFLEDNYPNSKEYITGWNLYWEKKGRYTTTWKYLYLVVFNINDNFIKLIDIKFNNNKINILGEERISLEKGRIKLEINKDIATVTLGDPKGKDRFIIEKISKGCGKEDESNPFALDQTVAYENFIELMKKNNLA